MTMAMATPLVLLLLGLSLLDGSSHNGARVLVRASRHLFSVQDDLLAFPQVRVSSLYSKIFTDVFFFKRLYDYWSKGK